MFASGELAARLALSRFRLRPTRTRLSALKTRICADSVSPFSR
jgi:hypothetical protein